MPYSKTNWTNDSVPAIDAATLGNMENGIAAAPYGPDATANQIPVSNGSSSWVYELLKNAQVDPAAAIAYSKLALAGAIVNGDIATSAAIAYSKLALTGMVADADISSGANLHKLSAVTGTPTGSKFLRDDGSWATPPGQTTYRKTTAKIVNNTVVETDLLNSEITVAAGAMGTTGMLRFSAWGDYLTDSGTNGIFPRFKIKLGATTIFDTGAAAATVGASATRATWSWTCEILNTATNAQVAKCEWTMHALNSATLTAFTTGQGEFGGATNALISGLASNTSAVDTTSSQALALTIINPAANALVETKLSGALVEIV